MVLVTVFVDMAKANQELAEQNSQKNEEVSGLNGQKQILENSINNLNKSHEQELARPNSMVLHLENEVEIMRQHCQRAQNKIDQQCRVIAELTFQLEKSTGSYDYARCAEVRDYKVYDIENTLKQSTLDRQLSFGNTLSNSQRKSDHELSPRFYSPIKNSNMGKMKQRYEEARQKLVDYQHLISDCKHPNLPLDNSKIAMTSNTDTALLADSVQPSEITIDDPSKVYNPKYVFKSEGDNNRFKKVVDYMSLKHKERSSSISDSYTGTRFYQLIDLEFERAKKSTHIAPYGKSHTRVNTMSPNLEGRYHNDENDNDRVKQETEDLHLLNERFELRSLSGQKSNHQNVKYLSQAMFTDEMPETQSIEMSEEKGNVLKDRSNLADF